MIRINLLPSEFSAAQSKREQTLLFGGAAIIVVTIFIGFWAAKAHEAALYEKRIAEADAELRKYQAIVAQIDSIEASKRALTAKRDVIKGLNQSRLVYPVFFEDFLPIIPSDVWMTNVQVQDQGNGALRLTLNCSALSNFALATFLSNLQTSPHFSGPTLSPVTYTNVEDGSQTLQFTITVGYQHKGPYPLADM